MKRVSPVFLKNMGAYQGHGFVAIPHGALITWAIMMEGGIQLNSMGSRFSNEHEGYSEQSIKVLQQPGGIAWNIYDERLHQLGLEFEDYRGALENGAIKHFASVDELARSIGASSEITTSSLEDLKAFEIGKKHCPFGRNFQKTGAIKGPPYYGVKVTGALFHTQGGLDVNTEAKVLRKDNSALTNLFAAGGAAVGVSGKGVEVRGFGGFQKRHRKGRMGINPKTGEKTQVSEKFVPFFKPGKLLKEAVNKG